MQKAVQAYFETQVTTTSQGELLIMLYDGAIKFLVQSKAKIKERDYAAKGILLSKAIDVISELDASLNPQKGGDLADNLHKLYFYCNTRLLNANLRLDITYVDEVIKILSGLREAYRQIVQMNAASASQAPAPADGQDTPAAAPDSSPATAQGQVQSHAQPQAKTTPFPAQGKAPSPPAAITPPASPSLAGKSTAPAAARPSAPDGPGPARPRVQSQVQPKVQPQAKPTPAPVPDKTPTAAPRPQLVRPMATRNAAYQTAAATGESSREASAESKNAAPSGKPRTPPAPTAPPAPAPQKQTQAANPATPVPPPQKQGQAEPGKASEAEPAAHASLQGKRLAGAAVYRKMFTDT